MPSTPSLEKHQESQESSTRQSNLSAHKLLKQLDLSEFGNPGPLGVKFSPHSPSFSNSRSDSFFVEQT